MPKVELEVPWQSMDRLTAYARSRMALSPNCARHVAAPVVAAELRRLADRVRVQRDTVMNEQPRRELDAALQLLTARADELDPEGKS